MTDWALELVPTGSVREVLYTRTLRRRTRYWCFRFRSEAENVSEAGDAPDGLRDHYEDQEWFDGWDNFGATWDIDEDDPYAVVPRWRSIHEEWDDVISHSLQANTIETRKNLRKAVADGSEGDV